MSKASDHLTELKALFAEDRARVDEELDVLARAADIDRQLVTVNFHAAKLNALSNREMATILISAAEMISDRLEQSTEETRTATSRMAEAISALTTETRRGTNRVALWTAVLAVATFLLFLATAGLVYVGLTSEVQIIPIGKP